MFRMIANLEEAVEGCPLLITSVWAYVNVLFTFSAFLKLGIFSTFRFLSALRLVASHFHQVDFFRPNNNFGFSSISTNKTAAMEI